MFVIPDAGVLTHLNSISHGYGTFSADKRIVCYPNIVTYKDTGLGSHAQDDSRSEADAIS
jgi:hypothetical protein